MEATNKLILWKVRRIFSKTAQGFKARRNHAMSGNMLRRKIYTLLTMIAAATWFGCDSAVVTKPAPLKAAGEFPLTGVEGRIDHLAVDVPGMRLFVAALGNNTVEVINLRNGQRVHTITGLRQPQGILYLPQINRLVVSCAADGTCRIFDGNTYELLHTAKFDLDADNMRYDAASGLVYVGYGEGALGVLDPVSGEVKADKTIKLAAHPESFQVATEGKRIFINVPGASHVAVADRETNAAPIIAPLSDVVENYPMALDETNHRLFVGCREPANLLVMDTERGIFVATLPCAGDADEVFYDAVRKRIYVSGGAGYVSVFQQKDADNYEELPRVNTAPGGRTSLFVPELRKLYVAVPHQGTQAAAIKVYEAQ